MGRPRDILREIQNPFFAHDAYKRADLFRKVLETHPFAMRSELLTRSEQDEMALFILREACRVSGGLKAWARAARRRYEARRKRREDDGQALQALQTEILFRVQRDARLHVELPTVDIFDTHGLSDPFPLSEDSGDSPEGEAIKSFSDYSDNDSSSSSSSDSDSGGGGKLYNDSYSDESTGNTSFQLEPSPPLPPSPPVGPPASPSGGAAADAEGDYIMVDLDADHYKLMPPPLAPIPTPGRIPIGGLEDGIGLRVSSSQASYPLPSITSYSDAAAASAAIQASSRNTNTSLRRSARISSIGASSSRGGGIIGGASGSGGGGGGDDGNRKRKRGDDDDYEVPDSEEEEDDDEEEEEEEEEEEQQSGRQRKRARTAQSGRANNRRRARGAPARATRPSANSTNNSTTTSTSRRRERPAPASGTRASRRLRNVPVPDHRSGQLDERAVRQRRRNGETVYVPSPPQPAHAALPEPVTPQQAAPSSSAPTTQSTIPPMPAAPQPGFAQLNVPTAVIDPVARQASPPGSPVPVPAYSSPESDQVGTLLFGAQDSNSQEATTEDNQQN